VPRRLGPKRCSRIRKL
nr:Chain B, 40S ribosomal protein S6 [Homo sapiens]